MTVDPVTGVLLLLSDQSRRIAVAEVADQSLVLLGSYDLPLSRSQKPEGLDFSSPSRLLVVMDDSGKLLEIAVHRASTHRSREWAGAHLRNMGPKTLERLLSTKPSFPVSIPASS